MNQNNRVKVIPFPDISNAYIVISARFAPETHNKCKSMMSFFYVKDSMGVEWEPNHGPITVIYSCDKDHAEAEKHWYFDYCTGYGNWTQLAVNDYKLGESFSQGNYEYIFNTLKHFCTI